MARRQERRRYAIASAGGPVETRAERTDHEEPPRELDTPHGQEHLR